MKQVISILAIAGTAAFTTSCNTVANRQQAAAIQAQQATIDAMKLELAKQKVIDSMNEVAHIEYLVPQEAPVYRQAATRSAAPRRSTRTRRVAEPQQIVYSQPAYANTQPVAQVQPVQTVYQEAPIQSQRRGWSAKAKGAVIGAGTGAVAGAVINKRNRAAGAVIGGVLGAGAGTGIGAIIDRKQGR